MVLQCYSVHDKAVGAFMPPFYAKSRGEAMRMFIDACSDANSNLSKHPADYVLFQCGEFEDGTGIFSSREPERVISSLEVVDMKGKGGN